MVLCSQMNETRAKHILIVDDSTDSRLLLKTLLESRGYTTDSTSNGEEALALLNSHLKLPQAILLDMRMPVMDGMAFRVQQKITPRIKNIPVVIMGGDNNEKMRSSTSYVLQKPLNISSLMAAIERTALIL